jgi:glycosyltransferase involved in cell wall biosynthesis
MTANCHLVGKDVPRVFHLIPDLEYCGAGRQLFLLSKGLIQRGFDVRVCVLGGNGPLLRNFEQANIPLELLNWRRLVDIQPLLRIRSVLREFQPDVIHAWKSPAWRLALMAAGSPRLVMVGAFADGSHRWSPNKVDGWLLRRSAGLIATSNSEAKKYLSQSIPPDRIHVIAPGVEKKKNQPAGIPLPDNARVIVCVGPLDANKGYLDAIWAFDILKYLYEDLHLVIVGDGPQRTSLMEFVRADPNRSGVHFVGLQPDVTPFLGRAEVVWVPGHIDRGLNVLLEAMAAARPVVASQLAAFADVVADGQTGLLYTPGDKAGLAKQTHRLLDDPNRRMEMGRAAQARVEQDFSVSRMVERYLEVYRCGSFFPSVSALRSAQ